MPKNNSHSLVACPDCDLLFHRPPLRNGERGACPRCGAIVAHPKSHSLDRTLIYALTALILFGMTNAFPFLSFKLQGREQVTFLTSGAVQLFRQGFWELGALIIAVGVVFPLLKIMGTLYVLIPLKLKRRAWRAREIFRFVEALSPWTMMEVLLLGVIVADVKLTDLGTIGLGPSFYSFTVLTVFMTLTAAAMDSGDIWMRLEEK